MAKLCPRGKAAAKRKFDELENASDNLRKTGYYEHWPSDYYEGTVLKRQTYRRYRSND